MSDERNAQLVSVAIIGQSHARLFRTLVQRILDSPNLRVVGKFATIEEALSGGLAETLAADVVVVLQAFSDEYSATYAGQLIGRMLFGRVLCCYGPWCLSDGRTHDIWPVVARVSVASAWSVLEQEVRNIRAGRPTLMPMAAAEEVFVHRSFVETVEYPISYDAMLIASDDRTLRETIAEVLRHTANQVFDCGTSVVQLQQGLRKLNAAIAVHCKVNVLLDIDGLEGRESELLQVIQTEVPTSHLLRLSSFPQSIADDGPYDQIIDKLDISVLLAIGRS